MNKVTVEFLQLLGFRLTCYPDGWFWIKRYTSHYHLQANEAYTQFTEDDNGHVEDLTEQQFIDTIVAHQKAINQ